MRKCEASECCAAAGDQGAAAAAGDTAAAAAQRPGEAARCHWSRPLSVSRRTERRGERGGYLIQ